MKRLPGLLLTTSLLFPGTVMGAPASVANPLDGTWKEDMKTAKFTGKPLVISVVNGVYHCTTCVPPSTFKADGKPHEVPDQPYYDTGMATVVSPAEVDLAFMKAGKTVLTQVITASADGMTTTWKGTDATASSGVPVDFSYTARRVGEPAAGAHAVSGAWTAETVGVSDSGVTVTFRTIGDMLTMTSPTGQSYTAQIDGPQAPYQGDPGTTTVAIRKIDARSYQETDYRDGTVMSVTTTTVAADGKTAKVVSEFVPSDEHMEVTAFRQ